jgi:hypothetical protein
MREEIQRMLGEWAARCDGRVDVFEVQIMELGHGGLSLGGSVLNVESRNALEAELALRFPELGLDLDSVAVLHHPGVPRMHVTTNLTGLYEKPGFGVPLVSELPYGWELEILEVRDNWALTRQSDGYLGWAYLPYLSEGSAPQTTHLVLAPSIELRDAPGAGSNVVTRVVSGTGVRLEQEIPDGWARVDANRSGWMPAGQLRAIADLPQTAEARRALLLEDAARMVGTPYLWGGLSGHGIDCSGLSFLLHRWIGLRIPRDADMQHAAARAVEPPFEPGDLLFFAEPGVKPHVSHVGVSLGGWSMMHASRSRNGVYLDEVQATRSLRDLYYGAGSFLR